MESKKQHSSELRLVQKRLRMTDKGSQVAEVALFYGFGDHCIVLEYTVKTSDATTIHYTALSSLQDNLIVMQVYVRVCVCYLYARYSTLLSVTFFYFFLLGISCKSFFFLHGKVIEKMV